MAFLSHRLCLDHRPFPSVSKDRVAPRGLAVGAAPLIVVLVEVAVLVVPVVAQTDKHNSTIAKISPRRVVGVA